MGKRKTISVEQVLTYANMQLKGSVTPSGHRDGICTMIEQVLMDTGNYAGFRYLTSVDVPTGHTPGIHYDEGGILPYPERFVNTDESRREYFIK
jgi:hypothetical protein